MEAIGFNSVSKLDIRRFRGLLMGRFQWPAEELDNISHPGCSGFYQNGTPSFVSQDSQALIVLANSSGGTSPHILHIPSSA
jgi:hypothetical protein